jgi:hypothetical protein
MLASQCNFTTSYRGPNKEQPKAPNLFCTLANMKGSKTVEAVCKCIGRFFRWNSNPSSHFVNY